MDRGVPLSGSRRIHRILCLVYAGTARSCHEHRARVRAHRFVRTGRRADLHPLEPLRRRKVADAQRFGRRRTIIHSRSDGQIRYARRRIGCRRSRTSIGQAARQEEQGEDAENFLHSTNSSGRSRVRLLPLYCAAARSATCSWPSSPDPECRSGRSSLGLPPRRNTHAHHSAERENLRARSVRMRRRRDRCGSRAARANLRS